MFRHRTTGLQAAQVALAGLLDAWRDQLAADEFATLIDLHGRRVDAERARLAQLEPTKIKDGEDVDVGIAA